MRREDEPLSPSHWLGVVVAVSALASASLPAPPAWADTYVRASAPQYESPGGTVPVIVTMYGIPSGTTSVDVTARGTGGSTATCAGPVWINRGRGTASRTCYLALPRVSGSFNIVATATALRPGGGSVTRSGSSGRAILANGPVSNGSPSLAQMRSIERCSNPGSQVWLTFDDGANATQLSNILSTLSRNDVRGRFFFTGAWRDQNPSLYRRLLDDGHHVANHSYTHPALSKQSNAEVTRQIRLGVRASTSPKLLRPPFGAGSFTNRLVSLASAQGYALCRWTVDTFDWDQATPAAMKERVMTGDFRTPPVAAGGNILMHGTARYTSVGGLQAVIDGVRARRLTLEPLRGRTAPPPTSTPTTAPTPPPPAPLPVPARCTAPSPAPASATPTVSISATASQITAGARTTVYGYVADPDGCAVPGASVQLRYRPHGADEHTLQTVTTDSGGRFSREVAPPQHAVFAAAVDDVRSPEFALRIATRVTVTSPVNGSRVTNPVRFSGSISPPRPGLYVGFSRWDRDHWAYVGHGLTDASGRWVAQLRLPPGGLTLRTYAPAGGGNAYGEAIRRVLVRS